MSALALSPSIADPLRPQRTDGIGLGATLALLAHALLVIALALGVRWRTEEPAGLSAELWAAVPEQAAPPAPPPQPQPAAPAKPAPRVGEPPPAPSPADIALEAQRQKAEQQARAKEAERKEAEKKAAEKKAADAREAKAAEERALEERLTKQREENLRRMLGQAGNPSATGTAQRVAGPSAGYAGRIKARIKPNIVFTEEPSTNPVAEVEVRLAPDGTIIGRRLLRASGLKDWDEAVLRAIDRTGELPKDIDGRVPGVLIVSFRPKD